jgi:hypothetical protein
MTSRITLQVALAVAVASTAFAQSPWTAVGEGHPLRDRFGNPGYLAYTGFADASRPNLLSGIVCPVNEIPYVADCRPATSEDGAASWRLHDAPAFDIGEPELFFRRPFAVRSPANPNRLWYGVARHAWYATEPKGGLWRSDDNGHTWTENLFAGQPGESGLMGYLFPDPDDPDTILIGRGYDFGNVSLSTDGGRTFTILCGHNNVAKTGDERCAGGYLLADFDVGRFIAKVWWQPAFEMSREGTVREVRFPGVNPYEGAPHIFDSLDVPVKGLQRAGGGGMGRYTADGGFLYPSFNDSQLYYAARGTAFVSSALRVPGVTFDIEHGNALVLAHSTRNCTWVVQTAATRLSKTENCGRTWQPLSMAGVDFSGSNDARIVTGSYLPDASGRFLIFLANGRRYLFTP